MYDLNKILIKLDKLLVAIFNENHGIEKNYEKTKFLNAVGHHSLKFDLLMEDTIVNFFTEEKFPCIIESEENGRIDLFKNPEFLVITDPLDGSTNFQRKIPLAACGIAIAKIVPGGKQATYKDIRIASIRSLFSDEFFLAQKDEGAFCNGKLMRSSTIDKLGSAIVSFDIDHMDEKDNTIKNKVWEVLKHCKGTRRLGANLIDLTYVGAGRLEAMIDLRNKLSAIHVAALFVSEQSGAIVGTSNNETFNTELSATKNINFILACNQKILQQILLYFK